MALTDLFQNMSATNPPKLGGQQMFILQKEEIAKAITERWTLKEIWKALNNAGKMPVGYRAFTKYVYKFITHPEKPASHKIDDKTEKKDTTKGKVVDSVSNGAQWQPRGVGNIPARDDFGREVDMTDAFKSVE